MREKEHSSFLYLIKEGEFELSKKITSDAKGEADISEFMNIGNRVRYFVNICRKQVVLR